MKKGYLLFFLILGSTGALSQTLYEDFNYTAGGNIGGNTAASSTVNNNWTTHSNSVAGTINVLSGSLNYSGLQASSGNRVAIPGSNATVPRDVNRNAGFGTTNTAVYYSFLLNVINATQLSATHGGNGYFFHFAATSGGAAGTFFGRLSARTNGAGFRVGIADFGNTFTDWGSDLSFGTTYLIVVKYDLVATGTADIASLWVNPVSLGGAEPGGSVTNSFSAGDVVTNISNTASVAIRNSSATPNAEIDEIRAGTTWAQVTPVPASSPVINVSTTTLSGFKALSGVNSGEQSYNVDGANLTANIIITPPVGFGISTTTGGPYTFNPSTITLTQAAGTVAPTPIYVVMNSTTLGLNSGNITHTSTGATTKNIALSGNVLAAKPTIQSTITIGAVTNSTVMVNFSGGNGARRILLAKLAAPVSSDPIDGTTYTANANFGSGTQIGVGNYVVYDGTGNTQLITGLTAGATYHFAIYDYNNGGVAGAENYLVPGGVGNATLLTYAVPYVWIGLSGDWQLPVNWAPTRLFPATNDSLLFTSASVNDIITNVPTQTVGYIGASLSTTTTLQSAAIGNTLTIGNLTGTDFFVQAGSAFNINTANALTLNLVTGATASVSGAMTFTAGAHKLTAVDAGAIVFNNGAVFTAGTGFSSNPFGPLGTTPNSVIFANGSRFDQVAGGNPFTLIAPASIVVFQTGSLFRLLLNQIPSLSGRTYANFEIDAVGFNQSSTGGLLLTVDNLTITQGVLNINLTGGTNLKGNISVAPGQTLTFTPASPNTLTFNGTIPQSISNAGTLTFGANQDVTINNAAGLTLNTPVTLSRILTFTSGRINTTATNLLTLNATVLVSGVSNSSYVFGPVKKIGNSSFTFPIGKINGYLPIRVSNFTGASAVTDQFTAEYVRASGSALGPITAPFINRVSACEYWTLNLNNGTPTVDLTLYWNANNPCNGAYILNVPDIEIAHFGAGSWNTSSTGFSSRTGTTAAGDVTWAGVSTFSPFTIASATNANPLPITINYFTGTKNNGNHLLNWKVTCVSVPSATIEMERSTDGRNYSSIYRIFATAVRCEQPFNYTDNQPAKGINYYRLKMTDADGKVTYSTVVTLINAVKGIDVMNIAPNPVVNSAFNLQISSAGKTQVALVITDMQGRILQKQSVPVIAGFNTIPMNVKNLAAGTYQLFGNTADGRTRVLRFVIQ